jgi:hypothetical protein
LSQVSHNLQSISIKINNYISNELKELISLQNNLKNITLSASYGEDLKDMIPTLTKHSDSITKLCICSDDDHLPLSFIDLFSNLQEIIFLFYNIFDLIDERFIQYSNFSKLQTLKIPFRCPKVEYIIKFLENNGKNLKKLYISRSDKALSLSIANFCPNINSLYVILKNGELDILKTIFISCQNLKCIKILCGKRYLNEKEVLETVANYSPNNFHELKLYCNSHSSLCSIPSKDLETFFISWKNRKSKKSLTLILIENNYKINLGEENTKIVEKYKSLGIVKFETKSHSDEENEEGLKYVF